MMNKQYWPYCDAEMVSHYATASAKYQFQLPAEDLVTFLGVLPFEKVLDIGSGTGAVASAAARKAGPSGFIAALDRSPEMLKQQSKVGWNYLVVGSASDIPFLPEVFDCAAGGFVVSHMPDYVVSLQQILRVLKPHGRFGATAWMSGKNRASEIWNNLIKQVADPNRLGRQFSNVIPWDDFFSERKNLEQAFQKAGFIEIQAATREYFISLTIDQYIATKKGGVEGTLLREELKESKWNGFLADVRKELQDEFRAKIEYVRNVHFVKGSKPGAYL